MVVNGPLVIITLIGIFGLTVSIFLQFFSDEGRFFSFIFGLTFLVIITAILIEDIDYGFPGSGMPHGITFKVLDEFIDVPKNSDKGNKVIAVVQYPKDKKFLNDVEDLQKIATFKISKKSIIQQKDCPKEKRATIVAVEIDGKTQYHFCPSN